MPQSGRRRVLWIGDAERDEFAPAMKAASRWCDIDVVGDLDAALQQCDDFACCVIAQDIPARYTGAALEHLRIRFPAAPIVNLTGTWCEGERRSGTPLRSSLRVPWHEAATTLDVELERLANECCPAWGYGETLTDEERFSLPADDLAEFAGESIAVMSRDPQLQSWLEAAVLHFGANGDDEQPALVVCDLPSDRALQQSAAVEAAARYPRAARIALLSYPRRDDVARCRQWGYAELLAKPLNLERLQACLTKQLGSNRH